MANMDFTKMMEASLQARDDRVRPKKDVHPDIATNNDSSVPKVKSSQTAKNQTKQQTNTGNDAVKHRADESTVSKSSAGKTVKKGPQAAQPSSRNSVQKKQHVPRKDSVRLNGKRYRQQYSLGMDYDLHEKYTQEIPGFMRKLSRYIEENIDDIAEELKKY